jgi:protein-disulfide isomerase
MASRKEQKEAARQRRIAEEQARLARERRDRRLRMLAGVVIGAVAVVAVAIAISSGGSSGGGLQKGKALSQTVAGVNSLLDGIPQTGNTLGNPNAKVTMTYYGDLECPVCQAFTLQGGFSQLVQNDVRTGKVKVVYSAVETATRDPAIFKTQQLAALAAGKQNKFWNFVELFYHEQGTEDTNYVSETYLDSLATQAGVDLTSWKADRDAPSLGSEFTKQVNSASAQAIQATPTLIFQGPKGKAQAQNSVPSYSDLQSAIHSVS